MKKFYSFVASLALAVIAMSAATLSPDQALRRVVAQPGAPSLYKSVASTNLSLAYTMNESEPTLYIFNRPDDAGYLVVSANDVAAPLLGYIDEGSFSPSDAAPEFLYYLSQMSDEIKAAAERPGHEYSFKSVRAARQAVAPLCSTLWNQSAPYNDMTPTISGKQSVTGCVATAMAQLMKYHNWPANGKGSISYTTQEGATYSTNFSNSTYQWDDMLDTYTSSATTAQKNAVALLMKDCGYSVQMDYSPSSSGAAAAYIPGALINYFDYSPEALMVDREYYTLSDWEQLIYDQFDTYGPVVLAGQNDSGGHCFVCDGYSSDGYFHINWGWGGMSDGYFLLSSLDPSDQGIGGSSAGYSASSSAVINVKPNDGTGTAAPACLALAGNLAFSTTSFSLGSTITMNAGYGNFQGNANFTGTLGLKVVNASSGEVVAYWNGYSVSDLAPGYYYKTSEYATTATGISNGTYHVSPVYKASDSSQWVDALIPVGSPTYAVMTVNNRNATLTMPEGASLSVTNLKLVSPLGTGSYNAVITATITNTGSAEFYGDIFAGIFAQSSTSGTKGSTFNLTLGAGDSMDITYVANFNLSSAGTYQLGFFNSNGELLGSMITVTASNSVEAGEITSANIAFANGSTTNVDPNNIDIVATLKCTGGFYYGAPTLYFFPSTGGQSLGALTVPSQIIQNGETVTVHYKGVFSGAQPETTYMASLHDSNGFVGNDLYFTTAKEGTTGIDNVDAEKAYSLTVDNGNLTIVAANNIAEVMVASVNGVEVANAQPAATTVTLSLGNVVPGVYIVETLLSDGSVHADKIVIR